MKGKYVYDYPRPAVTVDVVIITREARPRVLLIRRKHEPFAGQWALPGGFVDMDETLEAAARRELQEETGLKDVALKQLGVFADPGRDPRGRTISIAYLAHLPLAGRQLQAGDDAAAAAWHSLHRLPPLAFDHRLILALAKKELRRRKTASKPSPR